MVIDALITTRILVQFIAQIFAVVLLRRNAPDMNRPYLIWLYPAPNVIALAGWVFVFATTAWPIILFGLATLGVGLLCFIIWSFRTKQWPFLSEMHGELR
jgi:amino acid transporter